MEHERRDPETATVEALLNAFTTGAVSRREFLRRAGLLGVTAAGAGALADAAAPARARAQTTQKRELIVAQGGDISKFDPHLSTSANDIRVSFNVFDNLTSPTPRPEAPSGPGHRVEGHRSPDLDVQAALGRQVAQRRPVHRRGREVQPGADLRPGREDDGGDRLHHHRSDRGSGSDHAGDPHEEAGSADPGAPRLLRRPDRAEEVPHAGGSGHVQRQAGRDGARAPGLLDEGRQDRARGEPGLLGRQDRRGPGGVPADPGERRPRRRASQGRDRRDGAPPAGPLRPCQPERDDAGERGPLRRPLRPGGELQGRAAQRPAREASHVAGGGSPGHREGAVARAGDRAQRTDRPGGQSLRRLAAPAGLRPEGGQGAAQEVRLQERADLHRDHRRVHDERQGDVRGDRRHVEGRRAQRRRRGRRVLGPRPEEPREDLQGALVVGPDLDPARSRTG